MYIINTQSIARQPSCILFRFLPASCAATTENLQIKIGHTLFHIDGGGVHETRLLSNRAPFEQRMMSPEIQALWVSNPPARNETPTTCRSNTEPRKCSKGVEILVSTLHGDPQAALLGPLRPTLPFILKNIMPESLENYQARPRSIRHPLAVVSHNMQP